MEPQLTITGLCTVCIWLVLLPGGTEAAPIIPTQTAIIVLAAIAAVYFAVTGLCVFIVVLIVCNSSSNKGRRCRVRPALRYSMRGKKGETHQLQPISRRGEPLPDARLSTSEKGVVFRSVSREFMREDGGAITYTTTQAAVKVEEKPSPFVKRYGGFTMAQPSPLLERHTATEKPKIFANPSLAHWSPYHTRLLVCQSMEITRLTQMRDDFSGYENPFYDDVNNQGSSSESSHSNNILEEKQLPPIAREATPRDDFSGYENPFYEESQDHRSSSGSSHEVFEEEQPPQEEATPSLTFEERKKEARSSRRKQGRTESTRPLLNGSESCGQSESGEPITAADPITSHTISYSQLSTRTTTQDPMDYSYLARPKYKHPDIARERRRPGRVSAPAKMVANQQYFNTLPGTSEDDEEVQISYV